MGSKRPTVRKLPSGEKVVHYPDGEQHLIPTDRIGNFLDDAKAATDAAVAALDEKMMAAIKAKQDALDAGDPVPHDKRPI